jgi:hypothetical protein
MYTVDHSTFISIYEDNAKLVATVYRETVSFVDGKSFTFKGFTMKQMANLVAGKNPGKA